MFGRTRCCRSTTFSVANHFGADVLLELSECVVDTCSMVVNAAETVLSLLRNPDYCVYGDGGTKNPRGLDGAEEAFNEVVLQERGKFKEETLVNVGGRSKRSSLK